MKYQLKEGIQPDPDECICVPSFVIAATRVGGGPEERSGFWPAYREALHTNRRTHYQNDRIHLCAPLIEELYRRFPHLETEPSYYRQGGLSLERAAEAITQALHTRAEH